MQIALIPFNPIVGDFSGNLQGILQKAKEEGKRGAELLAFPELALMGYPPQDILLRPGFAEASWQQLEQLEQAWRADPQLQKKILIVGTALPIQKIVPGCQSMRALLNAAVLLLPDGRREIRAKTLIPFYDIFHEARYYESSLQLPEDFRAPIVWQEKKFGVLVCEDSWQEMEIAGRKIYEGLNPSLHLKKQGASFLINISASPFERKKRERRRATISSGCKAVGLPIFYVNALGANDEAIFDGDAFVYSATGELLAEKERFQEGALHFTVSETVKKGAVEAFSPETEFAELHQAIVCGIRDYLQKNSFERVILGISGGIDSAVVATLAVQAVGAKNVIGLAMPSKYSSSHSLEDAECLAQNLGITCYNFPIKFLFSTFSMALKPFWGDLPEDSTEENIQARIRGIAVMAFANKLRALAVSTGNKSELAVGYTTLYGDMCGALLPIGDLYKTQVYELAHWLNREKEIIPKRTLSKAPSAELKPNQTDQDTLPEYEVLDKILFQLIDRENGSAMAARELAAEGISSELISAIEKKVSFSEYKRKQAAPVLRLSGKAFGMGRQYPLTLRYPD